MKSPSPLWLFLPLVGWLSWCVGKSDGINSTEDDALDRQFSAAVKFSAEWKTRYAILRDDSVAQERESARLRTLLYAEREGADRAARLMADARAALDSAKTAADSLPIAMRGWMQAEIRGSHLVEALRITQAGWDAADSQRLLWSSMAAGLVLANDSLTAALVAVNDARKCYLVKLLRIGCPSRKTAFLLGAGAGVVGAVFIAGR